MNPLATAWAGLIASFALVASGCGRGERDPVVAQVEDWTLRQSEVEALFAEALPAGAPA